MDMIYFPTGTAREEHYKRLVSQHKQCTENLNDLSGLFSYINVYIYIYIGMPIMTGENVSADAKGTSWVCKELVRQIIK